MKTEHTNRFEEIYAKHYTDVLRFLMSKVSMPETAEDLTQDTFLKIAENCQYFDSKKASLKTWVFNYATHVLYDFYRTDKGGRTTLSDGYVNEDGKSTFDHSSDLATNDLVERKEIHRAIRRMMRTLTPQEQKIANLHFLQDLKYKEVCATLDISMGTVKGLISRIKGKLQTKLAPLYV